MSQGLLKKLEVSKYLLAGFSVVLFLLGCILVTIGIESKIGEQEYINITEDVSDITGYMTTTTFCILIGSVLVTISFIGCCGIAYQNAITVLLLFILLAITFILELTVSIYAFAKSDQLQDRLESNFLESIRYKYSNASSNKLARTLDHFQQTQHCCGYSGIEDWKESKFVKESGHYPLSCCIENSQNCTKNYSDQFYQKGCFKKVVSWFTKNMGIIGTMNLVFGIFQIFGMILSMVLYCFVKDQRAS